MGVEKCCNQKYQVLEINLISAYDLDPPSSSGDVKTRAVLWIDPKHKLRSLAAAEVAAPKWTERFLFIVDTATLNSLTTAHLVVELYCGHDDDDDMGTLFGISRVLLGGLGNCGRHYSERSIGTFREFHVRRPSDGVTRGVLNLGFTILNGLPISDDKLVASGLAIDWKALTAGDNYNRPNASTLNKHSLMVSFNNCLRSIKSFL